MAKNKFKNLYIKKEKPLNYLISVCLKILAVIFLMYIFSLMARPAKQLEEFNGMEEEESSFCEQNRKNVEVHIDIKNTYDESGSMLNTEENQLLLRKIVEQVKKMVYLL